MQKFINYLFLWIIFGIVCPIFYLYVCAPIGTQKEQDNLTFTTAEIEYNEVNHNVNVSKSLDNSFKVSNTLCLCFFIIILIIIFSFLVYLANEIGLLDIIINGVN